MAGLFAVLLIICSLSETAQAAPAAAASADETETAVVENKRMQAVEGSLSPWSGQFNLLYKGSSAAHPFSEDAPNPGHVVPPPVVTMSGTVATRYRWDAKTTMGFGTGLTTETPFQGPRHTTLADPYLDLAHSFSAFGMYHRVDAQYTHWTNHEYFATYGYRNGLSLLAESLYRATNAATLGLQLAADGNTFASGTYQRSQQTAYGFGAYPSVEYRLSETWDFRSVLGFRDAHNRNLGDPLRYQHPDVYQTVGAGLTLSRAFYMYFFVKGYPLAKAAFAADRTLCGFSTVINLF